jgi:hypothetical protein
VAAPLRRRVMPKDRAGARPSWCDLGHTCPRQPSDKRAFASPKDVSQPSRVRQPCRRIACRRCPAALLWRLLDGADERPQGLATPPRGPEAPVQIYGRC